MNIKSLSFRVDSFTITSTNQNPCNINFYGLLAFSCSKAKVEQSCECLRICSPKSTWRQSGLVTDHGQLLFFSEIYRLPSSCLGTTLKVINFPPGSVGISTSNFLANWCHKANVLQYNNYITSNFNTRSRWIKPGVFVHYIHVCKWVE